MFLLNANLHNLWILSGKCFMFLHFYCSLDAIEVEEKQLEANPVLQAQPGPTELVDEVHDDVSVGSCLGMNGVTNSLYKTIYN